ncbi:hypothetical protein TNCV_798591 [Trichonephila clavipes]|nr:hypothetical protein TNCV_798591 [Trichonephila clavipes]
MHQDEKRISSRANRNVRESTEIVVRQGRDSRQFEESGTTVPFSHQSTLASAQYCLSLHSVSRRNRKIALGDVGSKNAAKWEKTTRRRADAWGHFKWSVPIHVTGWKFLNCVIPHRYEETEESTPLYLNLYGNKKLYLKEGNNGGNGSFQRIRDEQYVLSRKQQNLMNEIKNVKQEWAMDQKVILKAKLNEMKAKNDLIQREKDILKQENDVLKTKENELNTKVQGMSREIKILKRVLQGKGVDRITSNSWRWNSRVKRLSRPPSALSQLSRSLANFSD